jgi:hypothetical protein
LAEKSGKSDQVFRIFHIMKLDQFNGIAAFLKVAETRSFTRGD